MGAWTSYEDIRSFVSPKQLPPVWIDLAGISYCDHTYRINRVHSDVTVIEYIISGTGSLVISGNIHHPSAGDIYILPEGTSHTYEADPKDPWVKIFMNLKGSAVPGLIKAFGLHQKVLYHGCQELYPIFISVFEAAKSDAPTDRIMEQCSMLLAKLLNRMNIMCFSDSQPTDEASQLKIFIDRNYHRDLTVDDIAGSIFRSNDYANKLFKRCYGITPYAYYIEVKIANAKALLLHTSLSVHQIAENLGYKNDQYFSKQFHKIVGMTATRFRMESREARSGGIRSAEEEAPAEET